MRENTTTTVPRWCCNSWYTASHTVHKSTQYNEGKHQHHRTQAVLHLLVLRLTYSSGIRDILVKIQITLMDLAPDPDPTPDPISFFSDSKDAKKKFFAIFFSYNIPTGTLSLVLKI
jgi:hypothetical protein